MRLIIDNKEYSETEGKNLILGRYEDLKNLNNSRYNETIRVFKTLPKGKVLDFGCGYGTTTIGLSDLGFEVVGIDLSQEEIKVCRSVWADKDIEFSHRSITDYDPLCFDYVLSNQVIEHVHNTGTYLSSISRVLKKDGRLVISLPNVMNPRFALSPLMGSYETILKQLNKSIINDYLKSRDHIHSWDPYHFAILLGSCGFEIEQYIPSEGVPFPMNISAKTFKKGIFGNRRVRRYSYTMFFVAKKVREFDCPQNW
jgi:2-polyprenyl-3-methyl-5-hydroxy-6-metoxy-1,4-benzoquinol methylase